MMKNVISLFKMVLEINGFQIDAYTDPSAALSSFKPNSYGFHQLKGSVGAVTHPIANQIISLFI
jgi:hypothetical protein